MSAPFVCKHRIRDTILEVDISMKIRDPMRLAALSYGLVIPLILFSSCRAGQASDGPSIEFTRIPQAEQGGTPRLDTIEGRVIGAQPKQQIVLYARSGSWWIQPFADQPFTGIQPDSSWSNSTHLGTEYAAILVDPEYRPPSVTYMLPAEGDGVVAVAVTRGAPQFWQTWWFRLLSVLAFGFALLALYRLRLNKLTRQLSVRFEERLAERTRIAQELHDTLLQGFISASMQLHVAVENLPDDSPSKPPLGNVERLMRQVIDEARNAVQGLRSNYSGSLDLEQAFSRVREELAVREQIGFRVIIEGRTRPLHPVIRDEVYRIGREALVNAFRHSQGKNVEVELEYSRKQLRILVRDDGRGIDPHVLRSGRTGHWGLSGMRERAEAIGARLNVRSRASAGTEVDLSVPGRTAFQLRPSGLPKRRFFGSYWAKARPGTIEVRDVTDE